MFLLLILNYIENNFQSILVLSFLVLGLICVYNTNYFRIVYYASKLPGPKSYPIIGSAYICIGRTRAEITQLIIDMIMKFSPIFSGNIGPLPLFCISSPEYVQEILTNYDGLEKPWLMKYISNMIIEDSVISSHVSKWKHNRSKIVHGFSLNILKAHFKVMIGSSLMVCNRLKEKLNDSKSFDILEYLSYASMDSITRSTMGIDLNVLINGPSVVRALHSVCQVMFDRLYNPWQLPNPVFYFTNNYKKATQGKKVLWKLACKVISEKRFKKKSIQANGKLNETTIIDQELSKKILIDILLEQIDNDPLFDDKQLREEVLLVILAGFETTATTLSYTLLNLAVYNDIQDKVCEELFHVLGDTNRIIDFDDLPKLKYMEMVIKETMRLYTTVPVIGRKVTKDIKLGDYLIPEGATVAIPLLCLHRNENVWKDPLKFDPERFTLENIKSRHPYAYLPFSGGPRNCIGVRYAWMFMKIALATLLSQYEFHTDLNIDNIQHEVAVTLKLIGGHQVRITPRNRN